MQIFDEESTDNIKWSTIERLTLHDSFQYYQYEHLN